MNEHVTTLENSMPPLGLTWGIKRSFVRYLSFLPDVSVAIADGAEATNGSFFTFAPDGGGLDTATGMGNLNFRGAVRMSGHGGMMQLHIQNPWISLSPEGATLKMALPGNNVAANSKSSEMILANLTLSAPHQSESGILWQDVSAFLSEEGATLFNDQYPVGQEMDPMFIHVPHTSSS
jgi:Htaa.